jgi:uncharacterized membrane protein
MSNTDEPQHERNVAPSGRQGVRPFKGERGMPDELPNDDLTERIVEISYSEYRQLLFSGPIPPPTILKGYNDAEAGLANRIVTMAEKQQDHRMDAEKKAIYGEIDRAREALRLGFIICIVIVAGAIYLLAIGRSIEGFGALLAQAALLVGLYFYGSNKREKERRDKAKLMAQAAMRESEPDKNVQQS